MASQPGTTPPPESGSGRRPVDERGLPVSSPAAPVPAVRHATRPFSLRRREGPWKDALRRRLLAGADLVAALVAMAVLELFQGAASSLWAAALLPAWFVIAKAQGLYDFDHARLRHLTLDEFGALFYWATLSVALTCLALSILPPEGLGGGAALAVWASALTTAALLRTGARALWRALVERERGLLIGEGPLAEAVARKLALEGSHHLSLHARLPDTHSAEALGAVLERERIERAILAVSDLDEEHMAHIVSACRAHGVKLSVAPPLRAMLGTAVALNHLADLPLIEFRTWDASRSTLLIKRSLDVGASALGLVVLAPLLAAVAVAVRLDSGGPALFRQRRAGRYGEPFTMLKFRTMVHDAEERLGEVVVVEELDEPMFKLREDPRVTRIGRLLRRSSLDELPQLWNVLRGEMSLVGPRPEWMRLIERYEEAELVGLEMRPGLTGPMQVHGRGELTFTERLAVEREYVENHSLRKDLKILLRTLSVVVRGHGAF